MSPESPNATRDLQRVDVHLFQCERYAIALDNVCADADGDGITRQDISALLQPVLSHLQAIRVILDD